MFSGNVFIIFINFPSIGLNSELKNSDKLTSNVSHICFNVAKESDELSGLINADEYSITLLNGDPATEILSYMKANPTDMLVMGNRGLNAIQELVMGSVSHKVVQHSTVPVLIVK